MYSTEEGLHCLVRRPRYFALVNRFRVTWSKGKSVVLETSRKSIDHEGLREAAQETDAVLR